MLPDIVRLGQAVKAAACQEILPRFQCVDFSIKSDGSLLTEADIAANQYLYQYLHTAHPDIAFLSEEMTVEEQNHLLRTSNLLWCLDPLDGTSNFAAGVPLFATSLALISHGEVVQAITYDPVRDELFSAEKGQGAYLNGKRLQCQSSRFQVSQAITLVDYKRLPVALTLSLVQKPPFGSQRNLGSCTLEWAWIAANRGQLYLHGGMRLWDLAAGTLLLREAGGQSSTLNGEEVFLASMIARSVVASPDTALFQSWQQYLHHLL